MFFSSPSTRAPMPKLSTLSLLLLLVGCSGQKNHKYGESEWTMPEDRPTAQSSKGEVQEVPEDVVRKAARPFRGYRSADERVFEEETFLTYLASADVICFGEIPDSPIHHYAELRLIEGLSDRRPVRGFELAVGFEMVRITYQPVLKRYEDAPRPFSFLSPKIFFADEWGYPEAYYAPVFELAASSNARLFALGMSKKLTAQIEERGLSSLTADQKAALPRLDFSNAEHRAVFDARIKDHPDFGTIDVENHYQAQVVRDEVIADRSTQFIMERLGARKLLIFAEEARCHRSGIPARMLRRSPELSVVALNVAKDRSSADGYDYSFQFE